MSSGDSGPAKLHEPVLVKEVRSHLDPSAEAVVLDGTFGSGGHANALMDQLGPDGTYLAIDWDTDALDYADVDPDEYSCSFVFERENFSNAKGVIERHGFHRADVVLADLGWSMDQLKRSGLGLTFEEDEFLDMRLNPEVEQTAADYLHEADVEELTELFRLHGEHRYGQALAREIVKQRDQRPIRRTLDLMDLISSITGSRNDRKTAARIFQALRSEINDELDHLDAFLKRLPELLSDGGRACVISFHSLEDRRVKEAFREGVDKGIYRHLTEGPVQPDPEEVEANPHARSARMRAIERRGR